MRGRGRADAWPEGVRRSRCERSAGAYRKDSGGAQVMRGGVKCREFCSETLESKLAPGLHACGELFDVTGPCGGYNLAWAWASGCLAGRSAAKPL